MLSWPRTTRKLTIAIIHIVLLSAFPISAYLILTRYYVRNPVWATALIVLSAAFLFFSFYFLDNQAGRLRYFFLNNLFYYIIYTCFGAIFFFVQFAAFRELERKELLMQNRESELSFLRSQLNPHFLFNSLNNIYSLVNQKSDKALDAIAGFSQLIRYMLYDSNEQICLSEEINYITRYIALQQLRFENDLSLSIVTNGDMTCRQIAPLLLIPFVENAFKHGVFDGTGNELEITINNEKNDLYFYCSNQISKQHKDAGSGIGLGNVRRRLELLYPDHHHLDISTVNNRFIVKLHIQND